MKDHRTRMQRKVSSMNSSLTVTSQHVHKGKQTSHNFLFLMVALTQSVCKTRKWSNVTVTHQCPRLLI